LAAVLTVLMVAAGCESEIDVAPTPEPRPPADECRQFMTYETCLDAPAKYTWLYSTLSGCGGKVTHGFGCFSIQSFMCQSDDDCPEGTSCTPYMKPVCVLDPPQYPGYCSDESQCGAEVWHTCLAPSELSLIVPPPDGGTNAGGSAP
jgi:hypothetical protein